MAPPGPPSDPNDPSERPDDRPVERPEREVADWDWGSGWDADEGDDRRPDVDVGDERADTPTGAGPTDRPDGEDGDRPAGPRTPRRGRRAAAAAGARAGERDDERDDDATGDGPLATGTADPGARSRDRSSPDGGLATPAGRRRLALAGAALLLVVAGVAVATSSGDDGPARGPGDATAADGGELRSLTGVAARAIADRVERAAAVDRYAKLGLPVYCGAGRKPWVALTFDDGPGPLSGKWIAAMAKADAPMTLFRIGRNVPGNEEYVRVQRNLGWDSGTHTQNHPALASLSAKDQRDEIVEGDDASTRVLGRPPRLFRPPYESHDRDTDRIVEREGMVQILWNVDTQDSLGQTSVAEIVAAAKKGMQPGSIILFHEVKPNTLQAMPKILAALREKGLKPVTISRMLASDGPSEAQLRKGYDGCRVDVTPGKAAS